MSDQLSPFNIQTDIPPVPEYFSTALDQLAELSDREILLALYGKVEDMERQMSEVRKLIAEAAEHVEPMLDAITKHPMLKFLLPKPAKPVKPELVTEGENNG